MQGFEYQAKKPEIYSLGRIKEGISSQVGSYVLISV